MKGIDLLSISEHEHGSWSARMETAFSEGAVEPLGAANAFDVSQINHERELERVYARLMRGSGHKGVWQSAQGDF